MNKQKVCEKKTWINELGEQRRKDMVYARISFMRIINKQKYGKKKKQNQHTHKYACIKKARTFNLIIVKTKLQSDLQQLPTAKQKVCETRR